MTVHDPHARRRKIAAASRAETRRRLLAAADTLFRSRGYAGTTVTAIAETAGVTVQTLYLAWGSKRALLRAAADAATTGSDLPPEPDQWRGEVADRLLAAVGPDPTAPQYLRAVARLFTTTAKRGSAYRDVQRSAATTDPELALDWAATLRQRRQTLTGVAAAAPSRDMRPGLSPQQIADTLWALANPDLYDLLTTEGGYDADRFADWLGRTLVAALTTEPSTPSLHPTREKSR